MAAVLRLVPYRSYHKFIGSACNATWPFVPAMAWPDAPSITCRLFSMEGKRSATLPPSVVPSSPASQLAHSKTKKSAVVDLGREARDLLVAVHVLGERFGRLTVARFLRGLNTRSLAKRIGDCVSLPQFGCGSYRPEAFWVALANQLIAEGYLQLKYYNYYPCLKLTSVGQQWLSTNRPGTWPSTLKLLPREDLMQALAVSILDPLPSTGSTLAALPLNAPATEVSSSKRNTAASITTRMPSPADRTASIMPNGMSSDDEFRKILFQIVAGYCKTRMKDRVPDTKDMLAIAKCRPTSQKSLHRIGNLSEAKIEFLGDGVLRLVQEFCCNSGLQSDVFGDDGGSKAPQVAAPQQLGLDSSLHSVFNELPETVQTSYFLVKSKAVDVEFVAMQRGLQATTVTKHLLQAMASGLPADHHDFLISDDMLHRAEQLILSPPVGPYSSRWRHLTEAMPELKPYQITAALSLLKRRAAGTATSDSAVRVDGADGDPAIPGNSGQLH